VSSNTLVGISAGGSLGSAPMKNLSGMAALPVTGVTNENFHEGFGPPGSTGTAFNNPFDLFAKIVSFVSIGTGAPGARYMGTTSP
jgi:hypothetical protein